MRSIVFAVCLVPALLFVSGSAMAWDDEGQEIVALVAEHYLSSATKDRVQAMLNADKDNLTAHDIAAAAIWADKYQNSDKDTSRTRYDATVAWHFAEIDASRPNIPEACFGQVPLPAGMVASRGPAKACVIDKIEQFAHELSDPKTGNEEKVIALKFLLNLVGDVHQPLRVADEHNAHGAMIPVAAKGITPGDLFGYWDTAYVHALGVEPKEVAQRLISRISAVDESQWSSGRPQLWALEAHQLGVDHAYGFSAATDDTGRFALQDRDVEDGVKTVTLQLSRAGVRLAYVLNNALAPASNTPHAKIAAGDKAAGRTFALATCSVCHVVSPDQVSPREFTTAPDFRAIANTQGISDVALHEFLFGPHPTMPRMKLSEKQADDVIAFLLSLRRLD